MTLTLELSHDLEQRLHDEATRLGLPLEKYALRLLGGRPEGKEQSLSTPAETETDEVKRLEARGLLIRPRNKGEQRFRVQVPSRGKSAAQMVIEDRR